MGTKFRLLFEDDVFSAEIHKASVNLFLSCLDDLTVYTVAKLVREGGLRGEEPERLAKYIFRESSRKALAEVPTDRIPADVNDRFAERLTAIDWESVPDGPEAFLGSERDLIRFAPVSDEFKALDEGIVTNSIKFRWQDVRNQVRKRLAPDQLAEDTRSRMRAT